MGWVLVQYKNMQQEALHSRQNNKITQKIKQIYLHFSQGTSSEESIEYFFEQSFELWSWVGLESSDQTHDRGTMRTDGHLINIDYPK